MAYSPGPWTATPPPRPSRAPVVLLVVSILVIGLLGGAIVGFVLKRSDPSSGGSVSTAPTTTSASTSATDDSPALEPPPSTSAAPTPTATPTPSKAELEERARKELEQQSAEDLLTADPRGQWVAQLSGKYIGITDAEQTNTTGGHTFRAVDILADYTATKTTAEKRDVTVVLIKGSTILKGRQEPSGHVFWFVFALEFPSKASVETFCAELYPDLNGSARTNRCYPTQLKP